MNTASYFSETAASLDGQELFVICEDIDGCKFVCPKDFWLSYASEPEVTAPVHKGSSSQEKIDFFLSFFQGREGLYAQRYYSLKTGKSGYVPVCQNEWLPGICDKKAHYLSYCTKDANALRFESPDIAGELLDLHREDRQISLEFPN